MSTLKVAHHAMVKEVLGPGLRSTIWTAGCDADCPGCIAPEYKDRKSGSTWTIAGLKEFFLKGEGITLSGGEPMLQPLALIEALTATRKAKDLGVICFSGKTLREIEKDKNQLTLLSMVDMAILGPYVRDLHTSKYLLASANQQVLHITDRYRQVHESRKKISAGIDLKVTATAVNIEGIPAMPDFNETFVADLAEQGITFNNENSGTGA